MQQTSTLANSLLAEQVMDTQDEETAKVIRRAIGAELRLAREDKGWSRTQFSERLPSGVGDRTILSYEHGSRAYSVTRLIEMCHTLGISTAGVLTMAFQRVRIHLENLTLLVDLHALLEDETPKFLPLHRWARNKMNRQEANVVGVSPASVTEFADFVDCSHQEMANHLARFIPDTRPPADDAKEDNAA